MPQINGSTMRRKLFGNFACGKIGARNPKPRLQQQFGYGAHSCATDTDDMHPFCLSQLHCAQLPCFVPARLIIRRARRWAASGTPRALAAFPIALLPVLS